MNLKSALNLKFEATHNPPVITPEDKLKDTFEPAYNHEDVFIITKDGSELSNQPKDLGLHPPRTPQEAAQLAGVSKADITWVRVRQTPDLLSVKAPCLTNAQAEALTDLSKYYPNFSFEQHCNGVIQTALERATRIES